MKDQQIRKGIIYRGLEGRNGIPLNWDGFVDIAYAGITNDALKINYTGSGHNVLTLQGDGSDILTIDKSGNIAASSLIIAGNVVQTAEIDNGNSGAADTIAWASGNYQKSTLTGNCTFTFTAPYGVGTLKLKLIQDGTGGRTVTWPGTVIWSPLQTPVLQTAAAAVDIVTFYYDGTNYYGRYAVQPQYLWV